MEIRCSSPVLKQPIYPQREIEKDDVSYVWLNLLLHSKD